MIVMKNSFLESVEDQISVLLDQRAVTGAQPVNQGRPAGSEAIFTFNQVGAVSALLGTGYVLFVMLTRE
jgi:hypothetical protein